MNPVIDEMRLQKCVDGELTDEERRQLLAELQARECAESWKTLALSFIENQVFASVFAEDSIEHRQPLASTGSAKTLQNTAGQEVRTPWWQRQIRPWVSVAASLCAGLLVGLGGHFLLPPVELPDNSLAALPAATKTISAATKAPMNIAPPSMLASSRPRVRGAASSAPVMNVNLSGLGNDNAEPVSIPVYSPEQWQSMPQLMQSATLPEEVRRLLEAQGLAVERQRQWYRAPLDDGREILVPTETMRVRHSVQ